MIYKTYGNTGKKVSALGFGGMRFTADLYTNLKGREQCAELLVKANEFGINYFDIAPGYCGGKGEEIFGMAFQQMKNEFYVSTKSRSIEDPTADDVLRRIDASLEKMNVEKINFFHMWCILNLQQYEEIMRPGGPYEGALKAKEQGLIEHICFSAHCDGNEVEKIVNEGFFEGVTLGYNAINSKYREKGLQAAFKKGIGVATMNSLGGGTIPNHSEYFSFLKKNDSESIVSAALRYNAMHRGVSVVLSGMQTEEELIENISCFNEPFEQNENHIKSVNRKISVSLDDLCTGCNYCKGCPQDLALDKLMQAYNEYILYNNDTWKMVHEISHRWGFEEDKQYNCIECGTCEIKCTQHLPVIERIKTINAAIKEQFDLSKERLDRCFEQNTKKVGIYGIGFLAGELFEKYDLCYPNKTSNIYLFDSDRNKWEKTPFYKEWVIHSPQEIELLGIEKLVVCNEFHFDEIYEELKYLEERGIQIIKY